MPSQSLKSNLNGLGKRKQLQLAKLLRDLKWPGAMVLIEGLYASADPSIRWRAIEAAGQLSGMRVRTLLHAAIRQDQDLGVRNLALFYLGLEGNEDALDVMIQILSDPAQSSSMRDRAADSIGDMYECRPRARRRKEGVGALIAALEDPSPEVRFTACFSLAKIHAREAVERLQQISATDEGIALYRGSVAGQAGCCCDYLEGSSKTLRRVRDLATQVTAE